VSPYVVWCPDLGSGPEDGRTIIAHNDEEAACIWARREDAESADYWIVQGCGTTVHVRSNDGTEKVLRVTGEPSIEYRARTAP
jgi:hypothetical protein